jgi:hypothetical protein
MQLKTAQANARGIALSVILTFCEATTATIFPH